MKMEFKKLELKKEGNWLKRTINNPHTKKSALFTVLGAAGGALYFYFTQGQHMEVITTGDFVKTALLGAAFGLFVTNSPCARGKC